MSTRPLVMKILWAAIGFLLVFGLGFCFVAKAQAATNITLEWDSNTEPDMSHYNIYRSDDDGNTWVLVGQTPHTGAGKETFVDEAIPDGDYRWRVTAVDLDGLESGPSNVVARSLESQPPAPPTNLWIKIKEIITALLDWLFGWA